MSLISVSVTDLVDANKLGRNNNLFICKRVERFSWRTKFAYIYRIISLQYVPLTTKTFHKSSSRLFYEHQVLLRSWTWFAGKALSASLRSVTDTLVIIYWQFLATTSLHDSRHENKNFRWLNAETIRSEIIIWVVEVQKKGIEVHRKWKTKTLIDTVAF